MDSMSGPPVDADTARAFIRGLIRYRNTRGIAILGELTRVVDHAALLARRDLETLDRMVLVDPELEPFYQERMLQRRVLLTECTEITTALRQGYALAHAELHGAEAPQRAGVPIDPLGGP